MANVIFVEQSCITKLKKYCPPLPHESFRVVVCYKNQDLRPNGAAKAPAKPHNQRYRTTRAKHQF